MEKEIVKTVSRKNPNNNKTYSKIVILNPDVAIQLTEEQFNLLGIDIKGDQVRLDINTTGGHWQQPIRAKGLCIAVKFENSTRVKAVLFGQRVINKIRPEGYHLEGWVSIEGKSYSCFTSTQLFTKPNGDLINVETIFARKRDI